MFKFNNIVAVTIATIIDKSILKNSQSSRKHGMIITIGNKSVNGIKTQGKLNLMMAKIMELKSIS